MNAGLFYVPFSLLAHTKMIQHSTFTQPISSCLVSWIFENGGEKNLVTYRPLFCRALYMHVLVQTLSMILSLFSLEGHPRNTSTRSMMFYPFLQVCTIMSIFWPLLPTSEVIYSRSNRRRILTAPYITVSDGCGCAKKKWEHARFDPGPWFWCKKFCSFESSCGYSFDLCELHEIRIECALSKEHSSEYIFAPASGTDLQQKWPHLIIWQRYFQRSFQRRSKVFTPESGPWPFAVSVLCRTQYACESEGRQRTEAEHGAH